MQRFRVWEIAGILVAAAVLAAVLGTLRFEREERQQAQEAQGGAPAAGAGEQEPLGRGVPVGPVPPDAPPLPPAEQPNPGAAPSQSAVAEAQAAETDPPPSEVKAVYATAGAIFNQKLQDRLVELLDSTELNAIVVDVKDGGGEYLGERTAKLLERLRAHGVYPIARMVVFQDSYLAQERPDLALKTADGVLWSGGRAYWVDPASREVWEYNARVAVQALDLGFREVNLDYIRFPSDGNLGAVVYPAYDRTTPKEEVIAAFASYIVDRIKGAHPQAVVSADVFAHSFLSDSDVGIGQRITVIARDFDVIAPMVYPSHYAPGNFGFANPAEAPYEVVRGTLESGRELLEGAGITAIVRPWLQAFDLGAEYTPEMVRAQFQATRDAGYEGGWLLWNAGNAYDPEAFGP